MGHSLALHPDSVCESVSKIEVDLARAGGVLGLRYVVTGDIAAIALPPPTPSRHAEELWRHTCFEAFLGEEWSEGYVELNASPSTAWAGYRFRGYREGREIAVLPPPRIELDAVADRLELRIALRLKQGDRRRLGLAAVIEEKDGNLSYWALRHPPGPPDFHHPDCFALDLPPPAEA